MIVNQRRLLKFLFISFLLTPSTVLVKAIAGRCYLCSQKTLAGCAGNTQPDSPLYHTILQYEQKPLLAPPLIIFSHIFLFFKIIYRICRHRKRTFNRGLKLFLNAKEIEKLRDFEEECVHELSLIHI